MAEGATLEARGVRVRAGQTLAVQGVDATFRAGEFAAIIGPNGAGKSTLLRLVNRLLEPTSGDIRVGGVSVLAQDPVALRRRLGYVIQSVGLFPHLTVQENVELVPSISGVASGSPHSAPRASTTSTMICAVAGCDGSTSRASARRALVP